MACGAAGRRRARCYYPAVNHDGAQLPAEFRVRMRQLLGAEAAGLFRALSLPPSVGLRLNGLRGPGEQLARLLPWRLTPVPWSASGFVVEGDQALPPGQHPYQAAGVYYLQDPAAMAVAEALAPRPGQLVLDLAAAPGGKSTHLASLLQGQGWLVANDVHPQRARLLVGNLERLGVSNATITNESPARLAQAWPGAFDRVLLDAPCSGEGMFRKSEQALNQWSPAYVLSCARLQDQLLLEAAQLVKPGGLLAYSTCTLNPEENEGSVARFLAASGFQLLPLALAGTSPGRPDWSGGADLPELSGAARVWPHLAPGEGHFVALMRRPDGPAQAAPNTKARKGAAGDGPNRAAHEAWRLLAGELLAPDGPELLPSAQQGDWLISAPPTGLPLGGLRWLRHGLQLGRVRQGRRSVRVEPAHALAMALPAGAPARRLSLAPDDPRVSAYLAGADVPSAGAQGYLRVEVDGFPLGWGKRSGASVRSLLPKGLR